jgi:hypothetical protein
MRSGHAYKQIEFAREPILDSEAGWRANGKDAYDGMRASLRLDDFAEIYRRLRHPEGARREKARLGASSVDATAFLGEPGGLAKRMAMEREAEHRQKE